MKKHVAEYLKLMSSLGLVPGLKIGLKRTYSKGLFSINLPGVNQKTWVRKETSDWNAFKQVFVWKEYEYPVAFMPKTILDAGANVGYAALWFNRKFPQATIVSLEPEASNFEMLQKNTAPSPNIHPIKAGLWGRSCYLRIIPTDWGNWGFRTEEVNEATSDSIKALSIKEIMDTNGWSTIDLLKMDIEGAERHVFANGADQWLPKVKMMFLELHDNVYKDCSRNVFKVLLDYDFRVDLSGENLILINNAY
ncbi:MAG: FkbM family methyltransferase [Chitinophagaceae bacterium]|nr:MAG: FkbM family methyltransferase [Chitinophagaceae bacterium]